MSVIMAILNWFSLNILQQPAFFVGLLVLVGLHPIKETLARCLFRIRKSNGWLFNS